MCPDLILSSVLLIDVWRLQQGLSRYMSWEENSDKKESYRNLDIFMYNIQVHVP